MMPTQVKVCLECGEEYRLEAVRCADCWGELEVREADAGAVLAEPQGERAARVEELADHRVVFLTPRAADLVPLAESLRENEIPYRLAEQSARDENAPPRYALLVPEARAVEALRALAPLLVQHGDPEELQGIEAPFEPDRGYSRCPACGAEQPPGAVECAECGLGLGSEEDKE